MRAESGQAGVSAGRDLAAAESANGARRRRRANAFASESTVGPVERALALRSVPLFHGLRAPQLAILAQHMREDIAPRGSVLQRAGDRVRAAYLLSDGRVREQGEGDRLASLDPPQVLGLMPLLAGQPTDTTAIAETDVSALVIDGAVLFDVLEEHFSLLLHIAQVLGRQIADLEKELACYEPPTGGAPPEPRGAATDSFDLVQCLLCLQGAPELRELGVAVLAALVREHGAVRLDAGRELFAAGAPANAFFVLLNGEMDCTPSTDQGRFRAGPGDVLGRDAALAGLPYPYSAVAAGPAAAIRIETQVFWDVAEDHFHVARAALAMVARRLLWLEGRRAQPGAQPALPAPEPAEEEQ